MCSVCILTHSYIAQHALYTHDVHNTTHTNIHTGSDARLSTRALGTAVACITVKGNTARPLHGQVWIQLHVCVCMCD
jgi:ABC-type tungstate transport system substrate-binding protein